ncbi:MAG: hypothetical protein ACYCS7_00195 [Acidimicrobiales bacterium]
MKFWQAVAFIDTDQLLALAQVSDQVGYHGIMVSDHVFYPRRLDSAYPYSPTGAPGWDPARRYADSLDAKVQAVENFAHSVIDKIG